MPPEEQPKDPILNSWKEIAACLGVTVRSAQRWEQTAGLPVYRQGSGTKARVFAYSDELLRWREAGGAPEKLEPPPPAAATGSRRLWFGLAGGLLLLLAAAGTAWRAGLFRPGVPADWIVERSVLKVSDAEGKVLWQQRLPHLVGTMSTETVDKVLIDDIDGDGRKEVLFNYASDDPISLAGSLICFESTGRLRWKTPYGAPKTFGSRSFAQNYKGCLIRTVRVGEKRRVLSVANHYPWYPAQVALIDPATGRVLGEYWHPGAIYQCVLHDIDKDGREEAILGAINNPGTGLGHAGLAVLRLPFSSAPRNAAAASNEFPPVTGGGEAAYILFPQPDLNTVKGILPIIFEMGIDQNRRMVVKITTGDGAAVYYLDFKLNVLEYRFSDGFAPLHNLLHRQGLLDHALTSREMDALGRVVRFPAAPDGNDPRLRKFWEF